MNEKITPTFYEKMVAGAISKMLEEAISFKPEVTHSHKMVGKSGQPHEIDISATAFIGPVKLLFISECKMYRTRKVGVDEVLEFQTRIDDLAANKGIVVTPLGYEAGAIKIAKAYNIALLTLDVPDPAEVLAKAFSDIESVVSWVSQTNSIPAHQLSFNKFAANLAKVVVESLIETLQNSHPERMDS